MNESLRKRLDLQLANEDVMRKSARLDYDEATKLAALIMTSSNRLAEEQQIRDCRALLKTKAGIFSNWRGIMNLVVLTKMCMADDAAAYIDAVQDVYRKLTANKLFRTEYQALCAMTIYDLTPSSRIDEVIERTLAQYELVRKTHPWLTDSSDLTLIALMVLSGADAQVMNQRAEACLELVKPHLKLYPDTAQMVSQVLSLSEKPAGQKVDGFWSLYEDLKRAKHHPSKDRMISILATFTDVHASRSQLVREIGEADDYLKGHKGYGVLGVGSRFRAMMAATMVLQEHEGEIAGGHSIATSSALAEVVTVQIIETIIMIIVITSVNASISSNSSK